MSSLPLEYPASQTENSNANQEVIKALQCLSMLRGIQRAVYKDSYLDVIASFGACFDEHDTFFFRLLLAFFDADLKCHVHANQGEHHSSTATKAPPQGQVVNE